LSNFAVASPHRCLASWSRSFIVAGLPLDLFLLFSSVSFHLYSTLPLSFSFHSFPSPLLSFPILTIPAALTFPHKSVIPLLITFIYIFS
jgi:hypothetical protein